MDLYLFQLGTDTIILQASSAQQAKCRAYYEAITDLSVTHETLERNEWPSDEDYTVADASEPIILKGG